MKNMTKIENRNQEWNNDANGKLFRGIANIIADYYAKEHSERIKAGIRASKERKLNEQTKEKNLCS